jgi:hypothetical protein
VPGDEWRRINIGSTDFLDFRTRVTSFYKLTVGLFYHIVLISGQMFITLQRYDYFSEPQQITEILSTLVFQDMCYINGKDTKTNLFFYKNVIIFCVFVQNNGLFITQEIKKECTVKYTPYG